MLRWMTNMWIWGVWYGPNVIIAIDYRRREGSEGARRGQRGTEGVRGGQRGPEGARRGQKGPEGTRWGHV